MKPIKTRRNGQISSCLRFVDKNGQSYELNREERRKIAQGKAPQKWTKPDYYLER